MPYICPATGHAVDEPDGEFCGDHGARLFTHCRTCSGEWSVTWDPKTYDGEKGTDFCSRCGSPAPWLSRRKLIQWLKAQVQASALEAAQQLELREVLDRISEMNPGDTKTVAGWERLRELAPTVWENANPIIRTLVTEGVKRALGF